jgi:hypothetical protein
VSLYAAGAISCARRAASLKSFFIRMNPDEHFVLDARPQGMAPELFE